MFTALYHTRKVHATPNNDDHRGCSVASLKGTYAFHRTGVNNVLGPIAQIGINVENGEGRIKLIRTTRSQNGVILDWSRETTRSIRTVPGRSLTNRKTSSSLTEARDTSCSARTRAQPSRKRGRGSTIRTNGALTKLDATSSRPESKRLG